MNKSSKLILSIFLFIGGNVSLYSQNEPSNWYFGNGAGLKFQNNSVSVLTNGNLYTEEGSTSISDDNGNLLFYSNGVTVWNKNHQIMDEGSGLNGGLSSTQSGIIVKKPNSPNLYYLFTVAERAEYIGLNYAVIDIKQNKGLGKVIKKNVPLLNQTCEKLTVIKLKNRNGFWVIVHQWNSNKFHAFKLTSRGVNLASVVSKIGMLHRDNGSKTNNTAIGYLIASPSGKKVASAVCYKPNAPVEVFDFDTNTGKLSNLKKYPSSGYAYGLSFSPNEKFLYASFLKGKIGIKQYDLIDDDNESGFDVCKSYEDNSFGALQLASNGVIYLARPGHFLGAIKNPNLKNASCDFELKNINLGSRNSVYGLPNIITPTFNKNTNFKFIPKTKKEHRELICGRPITLDAEVDNAVYLWNTGEKTRIIKVKYVDDYFVQISSIANINSQTVNFRVRKGIPKVNLGKDTLLFCESEFIIDAKNKGATYKWSTGDASQQIMVHKSGEYRVTVTKGECIASDTIKIKFDGHPTRFKALGSFSPSNSGFNQDFDFSINDVSFFELKIYSPKNKLVFETDNHKEIWKGKDKKGNIVAKGVYKWKVQYISLCDNVETKQSGTVKVY